MQEAADVFVSSIQPVIEEPGTSVPPHVNVGIQPCPSSDEVAVQTNRVAKEIGIQVRPTRKNARNQVKSRMISTGKCIYTAYKIVKYINANSFQGYRSTSNLP